MGENYTTLVINKRDQTFFSSSPGLITLLWMAEIPRWLPHDKGILTWHSHTMLPHVNFFWVGGMLHIHELLSENLNYSWGHLANWLTTHAWGARELGLGVCMYTYCTRTCTLYMYMCKLRCTCTLCMYIYTCMYIYVWNHLPNYGKRHKNRLHPVPKPVASNETLRGFVGSGYT